MKILSVNNKRAGFAWLPAVIIGTIFIGGAVTIGVVMRGSTEKAAVTGYIDTTKAPAAPTTFDGILASLPACDQYDVECPGERELEARELAAKAAADAKALEEQSAAEPKRDAVATDCLPNEEEAACVARKLRVWNELPETGLWEVVKGTILRPIRIAVWDAPKSVVGSLIEWGYNRFVPSPPAPITCEPSDITEEKSCPNGGTFSERKITFANCTFQTFTIGTCAEELRDAVSDSKPVDLVSPKPPISTGEDFIPFTTDSSCFSSTVIKDALAAYVKTLSDYEEAISKFERVEKAYVPNSGMSHPTFSKENKNKIDAFGRALDSYDALIEAYESRLPNCTTAEKSRAALCISDYEKADLSCSVSDDRCYLNTARLNLINCFK